MRHLPIRHVLHCQNQILPVPYPYSFYPFLQLFQGAQQHLQQPLKQPF